MMVVLNMGEFENPQEEFLHYYVYIRSTDDVSTVFAKIEQLHSAESLVVYYDRADASTLDANFIVSVLKELRSIQVFDFVPTEQCALDNLSETIVAILDVYDIGDFSDVITNGVDWNQYSVRIKRHRLISNGD